MPLQKEDDATLNKGAPQEGEQPQQAGEKTEKTKSSREIAMEQIRANRNKAFEEESGVKIEPREPANEPATEPASTEGSEPAKGPADDLSITSQLGKQLSDGFFELGPEDLKRIRVRTKVEGKEELVDGPKALGQYQKSAAAEIRLEQATVAKREADALLAAAKVRISEADTATEKREATKEAAAAQQELDGAQRQFLDALYGGDVDKAGELFSKTVNAAVDRAMAGRAPAGATPDPEQIAQRAAELAVPRVRQVTSRESALTQLKGDYPDIFTDADYAFLTDRRINTLIAEGTSESDAIITAGQEIADKFGLKKALARSPKSETSTTRSERLAAKKDGLDEPEATAARAATNVKPPETASDVIARMRAQRGQL